MIIHEDTSSEPSKNTVKMSSNESTQSIVIKTLCPNIELSPMNKEIIEDAPEPIVNIYNPEVINNNIGSQFLARNNELKVNINEEKENYEIMDKTALNKDIDKIFGVKELNKNILNQKKSSVNKTDNSASKKIDENRINLCTQVPELNKENELVQNNKSHIKSWMRSESMDKKVITKETKILPKRNYSKKVSTSIHPKNNALIDKRQSVKK